MNSNTLLLKRLNINGLPRILSKRWYAQEEWRDDTIDITSVEEVPKYRDFLTEDQEKEVLRKRNKSRLSDEDRNRLYGIKPFNKNYEWYHQTIRFKQRTLGRYGVDALDVPVGCAWPSKEDIADKLEYEKTAYPHSLWECWDMIAQKNKENAEKIIEREKDIDAKLLKVARWKQELEAKIAKKEAEVQATKERKDRLIAEVRRQVGFAIDPRDERFKQLLEEKEKEDKKRKKEMKKKDRAAKFMERLLLQSKTLEETAANATESAVSKDSAATENKSETN
ncbi:growth arrest and DNA damage-inducible proteins-interacting protein 1 [Microplitis demolitor]|uniref:growth arrest and DNA damage-inducible proteins-interacting protein 1 n=1 Tax=Microplitis demolitor TaxID=69319 RepID=UPI0004CD7924|nr:growth arrest and DNA damage-inducible proteins-interacting protein 1 [Microplitis demolitor]